MSLLGLVCLLVRIFITEPTKELHLKVQARALNGLEGPAERSRGLVSGLGTVAGEGRRVLIPFGVRRCHNSFDVYTSSQAVEKVISPV